jgi:hypothetical protein
VVNLRLRDAAPTSVNVTVAAERAGRCPLYRRKRTFGNTIGDKKPFGQFASRVSSDPKWQACELDASHSPNVTDSNVFRVAEPAAGDETHCRLLARSSRRQMCAAHQHHAKSSRGADFGANLSICHHTHGDCQAPRYLKRPIDRRIRVGGHHCAAGVYLRLENDQSLAVGILATRVRCHVRFSFLIRRP